MTKLLCGINYLLTYCRAFNYGKRVFIVLVPCVDWFPTWRDTLCPRSQTSLWSRRWCRCRTTCSRRSELWQKICRKLSLQIRDRSWRPSKQAVTPNTSRSWRSRRRKAANESSQSYFRTKMVFISPLLVWTSQSVITNSVSLGGKPT